MKKSFLFIVLLFIAGLIFSEGEKIVIERVDSSYFPKLRVFVKVINNKGTIKGLNKENFRANLNGNTVRLDKVGAIFSSREWIAIGLSIDVSGSMKGEAIKNAKIAAIDFITRTGLHDKLMLITFSDKAILNIVSTSDKNIISGAVDSLKAKGNTALYDSIKLSLEKLLEISNNRKAFIVLTDGKDTASKTKREEVLKFVKESKIIVYSVGLGKNIHERFLKDVAENSGGKYFNAPKPDDLAEIYRTISKELSNLYFIEFTSPIKDKSELSKVHKLSVDLLLRGHEYNVRTKFFPANVAFNSNNRIIASGENNKVKIESTEKKIKQDNNIRKQKSRQQVKNKGNHNKNNFSVNELFPEIYFILLFGVFLASIIGVIFRKEMKILYFIIILLLIEILSGIFFILFKIIK